MSSNLERKARRKKQTRLTFDPIDQSSSPARMSPAKVRYQLPGRQKSSPLRLDDESDDILSTTAKRFSPRIGQMGRAEKKAKLPLPTPAKSSQPPLKPVTANYGMLISPLRWWLHLKWSRHRRLSSEGPYTMEWIGGLTLFTDSLDEDEDDGSDFRPFASATKRRNTGAMESTQSNRIFGSGVGAGGSDSSEGSPAEDVRCESVWHMNGADIKQAPNFTPSKRKRNTRSSASKPSSSTKSRKQKSVTLSDDSEDDSILPPPRSARKQTLFKSVYNHNLLGLVKLIFLSSGLPKNRSSLVTKILTTCHQQVHAPVEVNNK